jgi:hypothetical protein
MDTPTRLPYESWADHFGAAIDIAGDVIAAGAPKWGYPGEGAGDVYIFRRSAGGEWQLEATLAASDREDGFQYDQHFGGSVALEGTVIAVGAPGYDDPEAGDNSGAVYLFERDGNAWVETSRLTPSLPAPGERMGASIAVYGDILAVSGSPLAGRVATFQRQAGGWRELAPLPVPASPEGEPPYALIDLYGDTLAVSTVLWKTPDDPQDEQAMIRSLRSTGVVTLYDLDGDQWQQTFQTPPQEASLYRMREEGPFGLPIALGGQDGKANLLAVGKPGFTGSGREQGSVLLYERGRRTWDPQAELTLAPEEAAPGALPFFGPDPGGVFFGAFVDLEGNRLSVVSTFANTAYVFERQGSGWTYRFRMTPGGDGHDDFMRRTVALDGSTLLLGSPGDLGGGNVFVFELPP